MKTWRSVGRRGEPASHIAVRPSAVAGPAEAGDVIARREEHDGDVRTVIVEAPRYARIALSVFADPRMWGLWFDDDCVVLAGVVWYRPVGFADRGRALVCKLVRDDRSHTAP